MKKTAKILISAILCLSVAFCSLMPAFASEPKTAFIVVSGMNTFPLYKDNEKVFPTSTKAILKLASKIVLPLVEFFKDGDYDKLGDALFPAKGLQLFCPAIFCQKSSRLQIMWVSLLAASLDMRESLS